MKNSSLKELSEKVYKLKHSNTENVFWTEEFTSNKGKVYHFNEVRLKKFLQNKGFRSLEGNTIKLTGNIAVKMNEEEIFQFVLSHIETFEDTSLETAFMKQGETLLLKKRAIILTLPECEIPRIKSTKSTSYHFYSNGIIVVKPAKEFQLLPYEDAPGFVWEDQIKNREFCIFGDEDIEKAMFCSFTKNITNGEDHFLSLCSALGYMMHTFKDEAKPIAIIINDENRIDEGEPEGGTGKGILVKGLSHIVEKAMYNGKNTDFANDKFAYQNVKDTTAFIIIDDAPRNFPIESLFSVLTDDMPIERKHQPVFVLPYKDSPKFIITTNYTITGASSSYKRRRFDVFINNNYNADNTPLDDFGCEFFHGWDGEEWKRFDFFMLSCVRLYITKGLLPYETQALKLKMLKNETASEFYDLMQEEFNEAHKRYYYSDITNRLIETGGETFYFLKRKTKTMIRWVKLYFEFTGVPIEKSSRPGNRGNWFEIVENTGEANNGERMKEIEF